MSKLDPDTRKILASEQGQKLLREAMAGKGLSKPSQAVLTAIRKPKGANISIRRPVQGDLFNE